MMIRPMVHGDIETVGEIWLAASIQAHDFVPESFWRSDLNTMTTVILPHPKTTGFVYVDHDTIDGFISMGGNRVGCLFVKPERQGKGIGSALLNIVKQQHNTILLAVYQQNLRARRFYKMHGFYVTGESTCKETGCPEFQLEWHANCSNTESVHGKMG